ncbi:MAG TPA: hydroxysqualene dehydroxylase HpnE [Xanthobacteraceae bacterium]|jgi:squalene-associated FAD-dependent desaturase|nr:hydroxysqualene dehydroxylase HpnE [Xanthobacteraceae bacterium]
MPAVVHVIGAGLAGLSAAVRLAAAGRAVEVHEAANIAGGRCRSYADSVIGMTIDNGNHLLLSGNHTALDYAETIGSRARLIGPAKAEYDFVDLATDKRWTLRLDEGRIPWWAADPQRRVPGTRVSEYLRLAKLLWVRADVPLGQFLSCKGPLYDRLLEPFLRAALNIAPPEGSAKLASAVVRATLAAGGRACRPLIARDGLGDALIEPAIAFLRAEGAVVRLGHRLHAVAFADGRAASLNFGDDTRPLGTGDSVILAVPPVVAAALVPGLRVPTEFRAIVNAHFRIAPPPGQPPIIGVLNATTEWLFAFPGRLSVTVSAADHLLQVPREQLARTIWDEVSRVAGLSSELPPWQIVRERRATFAASPAQDALRPAAETRWKNMFLAGDWTDTGLPATIEGAVRSGYRAARLASAI